MKDIRRKTVVFFLGAGASMDLGFPSGPGLRHLISANLNNEQYANELLKLNFSRELLSDLDSALKYGCHETIDEVLAENKGLTRLGKVMIADIISRFENLPQYESALRGDAWLTHFIRFLDPRSDKNHLGLLNLGFITLNYERTLDFALQKCLPIRNKTFGTKYAESSNILHLHGSLGSLKTVNYGKHTDPRIGLAYNSDAHVLAESINVLHEDQAVSAAYESASQMLKMADLVYFIGFGFHKDVFDRFKIDWGKEPKKKYFGLRRGIEDSVLPTQYPINFYPQEWGCAEFVQMLLGTIEEKIMVGPKEPLPMPISIPRGGGPNSWMGS